MYLRKFTITAIVGICLASPGQSAPTKQVAKLKTAAEVNALLQHMAQRYRSLNSYTGSFSSETKRNGPYFNYAATVGALTFVEPNFYMMKSTTRYRDSKKSKVRRVEQLQVVCDGTSLFFYSSLAESPVYTKQAAPQTRAELAQKLKGYGGVVSSLILGNSQILDLVRGDLAGEPRDSPKLTRQGLSEPPVWKTGAFLKVPLTKIHFVNEDYGQYEPFQLYRYNHNFHVRDNGALAIYEVANEFQSYETRSREVWRDIQMNAAVAPSAFRFSPPPGVTLEEITAQ